MKTKHNWLAVRRDYFDGAGSLRDLSAHYGIPRRTLERRASREGWRQEREGLGGIMTAAAAETAVERGKELGMSAAEFVARSITELGRWMDRIEGLAREGNLTPESVGKLVTSWRTTIEAGRATFNLDSREPQTVVFGVHLLEDPAFAPRPVVDMVCEPKSEPNFGG